MPPPQGCTWSSVALNERARNAEALQTQTHKHEHSPILLDRWDDNGAPTAAMKGEGRVVNASPSAHRSTRTPAQPQSLIQAHILFLDSHRAQLQTRGRAGVALRRGRHRGGGGAAWDEGVEEQRLFTLPLTADPQRVRAHVDEPLESVVRAPEGGLRGENAVRGRLLVTAPRDNSSRVMPPSAEIPQRQDPQQDSRRKESRPVERNGARGEELCDRFL